MKTSENIDKIAPALLKAQKLMGAAVKGASNPFFKSKYADLGAVLEACKELLNDNGVTILQPHYTDQGSTYVETILLHESGQFVSSSTPVICSKANDPQALGSAITYARRYGLQSLTSLPSEDDDGEKAVTRDTTTSKPNGWRKVKPETASNVTALNAAAATQANVVDTKPVANSEAMEF